MRPIDPEHLNYVRNFVVALTETVKSTAETFEATKEVTPLEARVLRILYTPRELVVKQIAIQLPDVPLSTLTRVVDRLESSRLVTRNVNKSDRRSFIVTITEFGDSMVESYLSAMSRIAALMMEGLTDQERLTMLGLMHKIQTHLQENAQGQPNIPS